MTDKQFEIPIKKIKEDFQGFLVPEHNRRIIFSGPFGIGKTYFLNHNSMNHDIQQSKLRK